MVTNKDIELLKEELARLEQELSVAYVDLSSVGKYLSTTDKAFLLHKVHNLENLIKEKRKKINSLS